MGREVVSLTSDGIQGVRANPFLECQDKQTRSCFSLQTLDLSEGTCW